MCRAWDGGVALYRPIIAPKIAKVVGTLAEKNPEANSTLSGVLMTKICNDVVRERRGRDCRRLLETNPLETALFSRNNLSLSISYEHILARCLYHSAANHYIRVIADGCLVLSGLQAYDRCAARHSSTFQSCHIVHYSEAEGS